MTHLRLAVSFGLGLLLFPASAFGQSPEYEPHTVPQSHIWYPVALPPAEEGVTPPPGLKLGIASEGMRNAGIGLTVSGLVVSTAGIVTFAVGASEGGLAGVGGVIIGAPLHAVGAILTSVGIPLWAVGGRSAWVDGRGNVVTAEAPRVEIRAGAGSVQIGGSF